MAEGKPRDALGRIRVVGQGGGRENLRCHLGWHRVRFFRDPDDYWRPRCSRCRRVAHWYWAEGRP